MRQKIKLSKSQRKYVRRQKSIIRRLYGKDSKQEEELLKEIEKVKEGKAKKNNNRHN